MTLEQVVRPYQSPGRRYGKLFVQRIQPTPTEPETAVLNWTAQTNTQADTIPGFKLTINYKQLHNEVSRKTTVARVTNPEDPNQYVDVERIDEITFNGNDGVQQRFVFNNGRYGIDQF